jgi:hypothetical protein
MLVIVLLFFPHDYEVSRGERLLCDAIILEFSFFIEDSEEILLAVDQWVYRVNIF